MVRCSSIAAPSADEMARRPSMTTPGADKVVRCSSTATSCLGKMVRCSSSATPGADELVRCSSIAAPSAVEMVRRSSLTTTGADKKVLCFSMDAPGADEMVRCRAVSIQALENDLRTLRNSLGKIAGEGDSDFFQTLKAYSQKADMILNEASRATTDAEKQQILEKGIKGYKECIIALSKQMSTPEDTPAGDVR